MERIKVENKWTEKPVTKEIFGCFIEAGFAQQVSRMWSEMLYNRSFRKVPEIQAATWEWLGLDRMHYNENAPFWHNGYEEDDWQLIGSPEKDYSCGTHTFKGTKSLFLRNIDGNECGVKQDRIHIQKGQAYRFRVFAGIRGDISEAGLNGFGDTIHTQDTQTLNVRIGSKTKTFELTTVPRLFEWEWTADITQVTDIALTFMFQGTLVLSFASLMPEDNIGGWRKDVIERMREVSPSVVRFPGGCFVSFYNWENSIGNRDLREPQHSFYWGGLEENDVGLDEFLYLSEQVGFEPQICFNMMTSEPFKARQLVEYLNAPEDVGMGRLRMLNGNAAPYGVRLFEMDNEPGRKWTAIQYAEECVRFAHEMREADSTIELMMAAYSYELKWLPQMLDIAGKDIQYVIYREGSPDFVHRVLPIIRKYNAENGTNLRLVNTEWLPSNNSPEPFEDPRIPQDYCWHGEITNDYANIFSTQQISWNYALNGAHRLLDYFSYGGDFALANFNNMCNTWGQNVIEATKDTCYLSCMGKVFALFSHVFEPCFASPVQTGKENLFAMAVRTVNGREQLYIINHAGEACDIVLPEGKWICREGLAGSGRMVSETRQRDCVKKCMVDIQGANVSIPRLCVLCLEKE